MLVAKASTSKGLCKIAASPIISGIDAALLATMGQPDFNASKTGSPKPS